MFVSTCCRLVFFCRGRAANAINQRTGLPGWAALRTISRDDGCTRHLFFFQRHQAAVRKITNERKISYYRKKKKGNDWSGGKDEEVVRNPYVRGATAIIDTSTRDTI